MTRVSHPTIGAYADCREILDRALRGDLRIKLANRGAAINFRQRCYAFRKLLFRKAEEILLPGQIPSTPYDTITIHWSPESDCYLTFRTVKPPLEVEELEPPRALEEDEMQKAADELARQNLIEGVQDNTRGMRHYKRPPILDELETRINDPEWQEEQEKLFDEVPFEEKKE